MRVDGCYELWTLKINLCAYRLLNIFVQYSFVSLNLMTQGKKEIHVTFTGVFLLVSTNRNL